MRKLRNILIYSREEERQGWEAIQGQYSYATARILTIFVRFTSFNESKQEIEWDHDERGQFPVHHEEQDNEVRCDEHDTRHCNP